LFRFTGSVELSGERAASDAKLHVRRFAPSSPITLSFELEVDAPHVCTPWPEAVIAQADLTVFDRLPPPVLPEVVSLPLTPVPAAVQCFKFTKEDSSTVFDPSAWRGDPTPVAKPSDNLIRAKSPDRPTRIRPPRDVIKLEDRLYYLLQPPLESLLNRASIAFPFQPFPYQFDGVAFLYPRHEAILADEMGLGKTMQAITTIRLLIWTGQLRRMLLVCPKPLVTNWQREFNLWAPELPLSVIKGDQQKRYWQWGVKEAVVTIANYEIVLRDSEQIATAGPHYDLMILDESQRIKNRSSATSHAVRSVSRDRSWALTGTPVENSPEDLVGIFEFVCPGAIHSNMKPRRMGRAASDYILRRTKDQVLADLPPKLFRDANIELTEEQRASYQMIEEEGEIRLCKMGESLAIQHVFELILRLKQICNFDPVTQASAKLERLEADLTECVQSGRKAIIFSQWVQTLTKLRDRLGRFRPLEYHGRVPSRRRDATIEQFRNDPTRHVLLMSYGAGSVGLNLQFAGYVFLFDRWWNPAVEDQAINRAHRIGTTSPVTITRFTSINTIEERIQRILEEKRELFDTILSGTTPGKSFGLTRQEVFSLFNLRPAEGAAD